jgi:hypothetical protein
MTTMPTINAKGTPPIELLEQYELAINAMRSAISTVAAAAPNARDYQVANRPAEMLAVAQNEHRDRLARLESVMDELEELTEHISEQC